MNSKKMCKWHKEYIPVEKGVKFPFGFFCSVDTAMLHVNEQRDKTAKRRLAKVRREQKEGEKTARATHRAAKEAIKPLRQLKKEAQDSFNKNVRLRDYWEGCISCGKSKEEVEEAQGWKVGGCWDCGHFKTRGAKPQLRFNLNNTHKQCKSCNGGSGKFTAKAATVDAQYEANLIDKIGRDKVIELKNNNDTVRFDDDYYRRIKKIFNKKARLRQKRINLAVKFIEFGEGNDE